MFFPKFAYLTKNTPFFPILHVFAPLNDVSAYSAWSWKTTLITWIFGRAWYPPWHSSGPPGFRPQGYALCGWYTTFIHDCTVHPLSDMRFINVHEFTLAYLKANWLFFYWFQSADKAWLQLTKKPIKKCHHHRGVMVHQESWSFNSVYQQDYRWNQQQTVKKQNMLRYACLHPTPQLPSPPHPISHPVYQQVRQWNHAARQWRRRIQRLHSLVCEAFSYGIIRHISLWFNEAKGD